MSQDEAQSIEPFTDFAVVASDSCDHLQQLSVMSNVLHQEYGFRYKLIERLLESEVKMSLKKITMIHG